MVDRNKIIMNAFRDEIEKNAFFRKLVASIAGKVGKGALKVLKGISKKSKATS
ncbi:hypothetical protein H8D85_01040 [bacterium]|nr:hypothetical protein [bacterium]